MAPIDAHPNELARLDLFTVWAGAEPLGARFDPFRFEHRMAAYRQLIGALNRHEQFGPDNRRNPLWGLMFQHQWQFRSGRLGANARTDGHIEADAPWGYGNYTLCVLPWLGAAAAGVVPEIALVAPPAASRFRYASGGAGEPLRVPPELARGVDDWRDFFAQAVAARPGADQEPLRLALWKAHKSCLDVVARAVASIDASPWPPSEMIFLRGWCRMVDYLWAAAWPTDFDFMVEHGLDVLPERLLESERLSRGGDWSDKVRRNVANILKLARTPAWRHTINLALWQRVMRTREARDEVVPMLGALFNPTPSNTASRRRLVRYLVQRGV